MDGIPPRPVSMRIPGLNTVMVCMWERVAFTIQGCSHLLGWKGCEKNDPVRVSGIK